MGCENENKSYFKKVPQKDLNSTPSEISDVTSSGTKPTASTIFLQVSVRLHNQTDRSDVVALLNEYGLTVTPSEVLL